MAAIGAANFPNRQSEIKNPESEWLLYFTATSPFARLNSGIGIYVEVDRFVRLDFRNGFELRVYRDCLLNSRKIF